MLEVALSRSFERKGVITEDANKNSNTHWQAARYKQMLCMGEARLSFLEGRAFVQHRLRHRLRGAIGYHTVPKT